MASNEPPRFDDSEDEEDFNPAPADLSDEEPAGNDDESPRKPHSNDSDEEDGEKVARGSRRSGEEDADQNDEDGEDRDQDEDEDDDDDDDDEDIQQVSVYSLLFYYTTAFINLAVRVIVENDAEIDVTPSSILKPKLMTRMREKTKKRMGRKLKTSSTTNTLTTLLRVPDSTMTEGIANWTDAVRWKLAWMLKNKPRSSASDTEIDDQPRASGILLLYQNVSYFPVLMTLAFGLSGVRKARSVRLSYPL